MVLLGITIFLGRYSCEVALVANLPSGAGSVAIKDSGLLLPEKEKFHDGIPTISTYGRIDPFNLPTRWRSYDIHYTFASLGIINYLRSREMDLKHFNLNSLENWGTHFDKAKGLLVYRDEKHKFYIGPEGMSTIPDNNLGRFFSPLICSGRLYRWSILYDQGTNCFFAIDIKGLTVRKGPELIDSAHQLIDTFGYYRSEDCSVFFSGPYGTVNQPNDYLAVLNKSGRIDLLNRKTLNLDGPAGFLPRPRTFFGWGSEKPKDLLAYDVKLLSVKNQGDYVGMAVGSLSRQGTTMALVVFDKDGNKIKTANSKSTFFDAPGGPALTITKYIFESLHPPVLTLASFFTAYSFEARSSHRALL
jgi:hypothetical protein